MNNNAKFFLSLLSVSLLITGCKGISFFQKSTSNSIPVFGIYLKNGKDCRMAISNKVDSENTKELVVPTLPSFEVHTDSKLQNHDSIDNENTDYSMGALTNPRTGEADYLYYFKYTFFVKNNGPMVVRYNFEAKISELEKPNNTSSYSYDDLLRVRLYENNNNENTHYYETYAKAPRDGQRELIASTSTEYCINFIDDSLILKREVRSFEPNDIKRYTILVWLEGTDPQCDGIAPTGGSFKFQININGVEE